MGMKLEQGSSNRRLRAQLALVSGGWVVLLLACKTVAPPAARVNDATAAMQPSAAAVNAAPEPTPAEGRPAGWAPPEVLVPASAFHGVHGVALDAQGRLLVGTVVGHAIWEVDRTTGAAHVIVPAPLGEADDIAVGPRGELAWTSNLQGVVRYREHDAAPIRELVKGLPGINSLAFDQRKGKLYASQVFAGDALWELDVTGAVPPRQIARDLGGFNGFEVGPDGQLYGPLWFKSQLVKIDPANGKISVLASELGTPSAANLDGKGNLWYLDTKLGMLGKLELASGKRSDVRTLASSLDNLAIAPDGTIYITTMADNSIEAFDPVTGEVKVLTRGALAAAAGIALDGDTLYVADIFAFRAVHRQSGAVRDVYRAHAAGSKLEYPSAVAVGGTRIALSSFASGSVQLLDRATLADVEVVHGLKAPVHAIPLADDTLLVLELGSGTLSRLSGEHFTQRRLLAADLVGPVQMLLRRDGAVYVSESAGRITRVDLTSGAKTVFADQLSGPEGLAETPWGSLIVAEAEAQRLTEIGPTAGERRVVAADLPIGLPGAAILPPSNLPTGVAVDADGTIFVTADRDNSMLRIRPQR